MSTQKLQVTGIRKYKYPLLIGGVVIVVGVLIFSQHHADAKPIPQPPFVKSYVVGSEFSTVQSYTGSVHARVESDLGFRVTGKIVEKFVDEGQHVKKGQSLMRLDPIDLGLASKAALDAVAVAQAEYDRAQPELQRTKELLALHAASQQEFERAQSAVDSSKAKLEAAQAVARRASNEYDYSILKADADGVVTEVPADVGQVVNAGQVVVRLAKDGNREAVVQLPEQAMSQAKNATEAYLYTQPNVKFPVKLRELSAMADKNTRTYQARYTLLNEGQLAPLGGTITVLYKDGSSKETESFEVPLGSLYSTGQTTNVWMINEKDQTVYKTPVTVQHISQEMAGVTGDIKSGDRIVALGAHLLKDAEKIRTTEVTFEGSAK